MKRFPGDLLEHLGQRIFRVASLDFDDMRLGVADPFDNEEWVRDMHLWRLDEESLAVLRGLLPEGIFTDRQGNTDGWIEDLTIYEARQIRLGVITHEHEAALNLSEIEHARLREMEVLR